LPYSAKISVEEGTSVIWLVDAVNDVRVAIVPSLGNRTIRMLVKGQNILHFPFEHPAAARADRSLNGIPFLAPWANRMAGGGFHVNGKEFRFNEGAGSLRMDGNGLPIHGMLTVCPLWHLTSLLHDRSHAAVTSRLEFWREPALMANWPFAHAYEMTHKLADGVLEITTVIENKCAERMPVSIGFHPYFRLPDTNRDDSFVHLPVQQHVETQAGLVPTGEFKPVSFPAELGLKDHHFDDGFVGLEPNPVFRFENGEKKVEVAFGPKYQVAVVYAPPDQEFVCFEPMTAVTNGVNLAAEGKYPELQWVEAGGEWRESFSISARGL
jgi:aldose 1-epimerase